MLQHPAREFSCQRQQSERHHGGYYEFAKSVLRVFYCFTLCATEKSIRADSFVLKSGKTTLRVANQNATL